jgi:hypothetical protein
MQVMSLADGLADELSATARAANDLLDGKPAPCEPFGHRESNMHDKIRGTTILGKPAPHRPGTALRLSKPNLAEVHLYKGFLPHFLG